MGLSNGFPPGEGLPSLGIQVMVGKIAIAALAILGGGVVVGCTSLGGIANSNDRLELPSQDPTTPIQALLQPPQTPESHRLTGQVQQIAPLVQGQVYQLQDSTGSIWVLSQGSGLTVGDRVLIQGTPTYQSIPLAGREQGEVYVIEQQQLAVRSPVDRPQPDGTSNPQPVSTP